MKAYIVFLLTLLFTFYNCERREKDSFDFGDCALLTVLVPIPGQAKYSIRFLGSYQNKVYLIGENARIDYEDKTPTSYFESEDDAKTWKAVQYSDVMLPKFEFQKQSYYETELSTQFTMDGVGYALSTLDSKILFVKKSTDAGKTWYTLRKFQYIKESYNDIPKIQVSTNQSVGIIVPPNNLFLSFDGGTSWKDFVLAPDVKYRKLYISDTGNGYLLGKKKEEYSIYKTSNYGTDWFQLLSNPDIIDVEFRENKVYYITVKRNFYTSIDNGITWNANNHPFEYAYSARNRSSPCQF